MGRCYRKPPLVEALCQVNFDQSSTWDPTFPGLIYSEVESRFPERKTALGIGVKISVDKGQLSEPSYRSDELAQFYNDEGNRLVQVGKNLLSVHHLAPYSNWDDFFPDILLGIDAYTKVASPVGIARIGLRYINDISFSGNALQHEDYFDFYPHVGQALPQQLSGFITGIQVSHEDGRDTIRIQHVSMTPKTSGVVTTRLDIDYFTSAPGVVEFKDVMEWVRTAHGHVEDAFEGCIRDPLRVLFDEVKE